MYILGSNAREKTREIWPAKTSPNMTSSTRLALFVMAEPSPKRRIADRSLYSTDSAWHQREEQ